MRPQPCFPRISENYNGSQQNVTFHAIKCIVNINDILCKLHNDTHLLHAFFISRILISWSEKNNTVIAATHTGEIFLNFTLFSSWRYMAGYYWWGIDWFLKIHRTARSISPLLPLSEKPKRVIVFHLILVPITKLSYRWHSIRRFASSSIRTSQYGMTTVSQKIIEGRVFEPILTFKLTMLRPYYSL